jgi:hypothetical protein
MAVQGLKTSRAIGLALFVGAFFTAEEVFMDLARRRPELTNKDLVNGIEFWAVWISLTPLALRAAQRWPFTGRADARMLVSHCAVGLGLAAIHNGIVMGVQLIAAAASRQPTGFTMADYANPTAFVWGVFTGLIFYALVVIVFNSLRLRDLYAAEQTSRAAIAAELSEVKLESLRSQLRPHFLFNALNAISVLVSEDARVAQRMILRLSNLLRRSLDEEAHQVALRQELAFVNDYLDIQRARFGERLSVELVIAPDALRALVPVFLLQPLLENAIEYGKSDDARTAVSLSAMREHDDLRIVLADDGPGLVSGSAREGVGLGNTRARLYHMYGARATVDLGPARPEVAAGSPGRGARVDIRIPFFEASA